VDAGKGRTKLSDDHEPTRFARALLDDRPVRFGLLRRQYCAQ
jgi:hypothetical protein